MKKSILESGDDGYFISAIMSKWYEENKRSLPWRETSDAYFIWLSEIILQQTRVAQGYDYYMRFVEAFPSVADLAVAEEDVVLKLWQGLGYYSRARNLHATAKIIMLDYGGVFPSSYKDILSLKGVGEYTAAAVGSFAFGLPYAVVDGNVFRVLSRLFMIDTPINSTQGKKTFTDLANNLLDKKNPALHNQSIMEFGALQCVPQSPNCNSCPLSTVCLAYNAGKVSSYPVKQGKVKVKERYFNYFDIRIESSMFLNKRTGSDIWKNLYELPLIETEHPMSLEDLMKTNEFQQLFKDAGEVSIQLIGGTLKHVLSHRIIYANFYRVVITDDSSLKGVFLKIDRSELFTFAISRLVDRYFEGD